MKGSGNEFQRKNLNVKDINQHYNLKMDIEKILKLES